MSLGIACKGPKGIVLAADSRRGNNSIVRHIRNPMGVIGSYPLGRRL